jgi:hypothetical protein
MSEWVTREQIANELGNFRLIPYYIKLLDHLTGGKSSFDYTALHWIQKAKRTRWRRTWENRKHPAGYEWVYYPRENVIDALNAMNPNRSGKLPELPRPPCLQRPNTSRLFGNGRLIGCLNCFHEKLAGHSFTSLGVTRYGHKAARLSVTNERVMCDYGDCRTF